MPAEALYLTHEARLDWAGPAPGQLDSKPGGPWDEARGLQWALLWDFLNLQSLPPSKLTKKILAQLDVDALWVRSDDDSTPFTFVRCCLSWALDPDAVREAVLSGQSKCALIALKERNRRPSKKGG